MSIPRAREQAFPAPKGTWGRFGQTFGGGQLNLGYRGCWDLTGPGDCSPFDTLAWYAEGGRINRPYRDYNTSWFQDYYCDILNNWNSFPHHGNIPGSKDDVTAATEAAARTNPSRPYVDIPVNLIELGDVTKLIRDSGRSLIRRMGGANLKYQFGIAPLAGDLAKLTRFGDQFNRRVAEVQRLVSEKGLRRTVKISNASINGLYFKTIQSAGLFSHVGFHCTTTETVRAHCRWLPTGNPTHLRQPDHMRALVRRALLGLTLDASTVWETLPWSWMIDWGSSVGSWFAANRNIIPASLSHVSVMRHTRTEYTTPAQAWDNVSIEAIRVIRENKRRNTSHVSPTAHFPFLNGKQVGILASLAVTRGR